MHRIEADACPRYAVGELVEMTGMAAPSRGAREVAAWRLRIGAGEPGTAHRVDREEVFIALSGAAVARSGGVEVAVRAGDVLVVGADEEFSLANPHALPFEAVACQRAGGRATLPGGEPFAPPWAV